MMDNQREIYEALLAGETLVNKESRAGRTISMDDEGRTYYADNDPCNINALCNPDFWQIYKEPKWYENIPDGGVLCWCCMNMDSAQQIRIIVEKDEDNFFFDGYGKEWGFAKPLTKQEIQVFLSNAPEEL